MKQYHFFTYVRNDEGKNKKNSEHIISLIIKKYKQTCVVIILRLLNHFFTYFASKAKKKIETDFDFF